MTNPNAPQTATANNPQAAAQRQDAAVAAIGPDGPMQPVGEAAALATPSLPANLAASTRMRTPLAEFWRKFKRQKLALWAGGFIILLVLVAILAPWIAPYDAENFFDYDALNSPPTAAHWFGVDSLGRDIFSRILVGARISLAAGFVSVALGAVIGAVLGLLAVTTKAGGTAS